MLDLLQQVNFLEDLALAEFILHIALLNRLDCNLLACQLMHTKCHFPKSAFPDQLDKLIEVQRGGREFVGLVNVRLDVLYQVLLLVQRRLV